MNTGPLNGTRPHNQCLYGNDVGPYLQHGRIVGIPLIAYVYCNECVCLVFKCYQRLSLHWQLKRLFAVGSQFIRFPLTLKQTALNPYTRLPDSHTHGTKTSGKTFISSFCLPVLQWIYRLLTGTGHQWVDVLKSLLLL